MVKFFFLWSHHDFYDNDPNYNDSYALVSIYEDEIKDFRFCRSLKAVEVFKYIYGLNWEKMIEHQYPRETAVLKLTSMQIDDLLNLY
jgi:hypothetical protein